MHVKKNTVRKWTTCLNKHLTKEGIYDKQIKSLPHLNNINQNKNDTSRFLRSWNINRTHCWGAYGATEMLTHCCWELRMVQPVWKTLITPNTLLWCNATASPIGIYSNELKTYAYEEFRDHCQTWKQSRCLSVGWRNYLSAQASIYHRLGALISRNLVCSNTA